MRLPHDHQGTPAGAGASLSTAQLAARRERARLVRRRRLVALLLLAGFVAAVAAVALVSGGSSGARRTKTAAATATATATATAAHSAQGEATAAAAPGNATAAAPTSTASTASTAAPAPGSLPQTHAFPSADSASFKLRMAALWAGVSSGSVSAALPAFFPRAAYVQVKEEYAPGADWTDRLVHDYSLDLASAHELLGGAGPGAQLIGVQAVSGYGHWVPPGVCSNRVGYYEMPNARVVYRQNGHVASFGIASMISWRGEWYVVHLGAVVRESDSGIVLEPSSGAGTSAPSSTC
jgi:hypothetical protein